MNNSIENEQKKWIVNLQKKKYKCKIRCFNLLVNKEM